MARNKKLRIERRKRVREERELELLDQTRPENWGRANAYTQSKLKRHPFERWLKESEERGDRRFTQDHVYAAGRIATGFLAEYADSMAKTSKWEKVDGGRRRNYTDHQIDCIREYCIWVDEMTRLRLSYRPVIDMAVFEVGPVQIDRAMCKRSGWAKEIVRAGLEAFINVN